MALFDTGDEPVGVVHLDRMLVAKLLRRIERIEIVRVFAVDPVNELGRAKPKKGIETQSVLLNLISSGDSTRSDAFHCLSATGAHWCLPAMVKLYSFAPQPARERQTAKLQLLPILLSS